METRGWRRKTSSILCIIIFLDKHFIFFLCLRCMDNNIIYFIYLLYGNLLPLQRGWHAPMPRKERNRKDERRKRIEAQRVKPRTPTPALDALIGDEE